MTKEELEWDFDTVPEVDGCLGCVFYENDHYAFDNCMELEVPCGGVIFKPKDNKDGAN